MVEEVTYKGTLLESPSGGCIVEVTKFPPKRKERLGLYANEVNHSPDGFMWGLCTEQESNNMSTCQELFVKNVGDSKGENISVWQLKKKDQGSVEFVKDGLKIKDTKGIIGTVQPVLKLDGEIMKEEDERNRELSLEGSAKGVGIRGVLKPSTSTILTEERTGKAAVLKFRKSKNIQRDLNSSVQTVTRNIILEHNLMCLQLSYALLRDAVGQEVAGMLYKEFCVNIVAKFPKEKEWQLTKKEIHDIISSFIFNNE